MRDLSGRRWSDREEVHSHEVHSVLWQHVNAVAKEQQDLHSNNREYARLYSNREEPGLGLAGRSRWRQSDLVTENVIQSVVDTATSLIGKSRPKIRILTDNAAWSVQRTARQVEKYVFGMFQALRVHELMSLVFRDACVFGTGVLALCERKGSLHAERALIDEIVVDENEVPHGGMPLQLARVRLVSKDALKKRFPDKAQMIEDSTATLQDYTPTWEVDPRMVVLVEAWHRGERYTCCVSEGCLEDSPYPEDYFPFVFYHWSPPLTGFYGQGLAEALLGFQIRINELNDFIERCQDLIAVPRVAIDAGSKMLKPHLDNEIGAIIPYVGKPPVFFTPQALNAEIYRYKEQLKQSAFEFAGISKMAAQATRPEGIEAGVALRELSDNQSQRFSVNQQRFEEAAVDVALLIIRLVKAMGVKKAPKVFMHERFVETIDWPSVDVEENRFVFQVQPASIMSETPSGRLQRVIELAQYGVNLDQAELRRLLGHPDVGLADSRATSALDDAEWVVEELSKGELPMPEPFQDLPLCIDRVRAAYLDARRGGAPEEILEGFRQWVTLAERLLPKPEPQPTLGPDPMAAAQPGLPLAAAMEAGALPSMLMPPQQAAPPVF